MHNKKQIKQKALALTVTSVMSASFMINNDSAQAMKKLKAIGNSIKKAVTQEDKKQMQQQKQLENEIAKLMYNRLNHHRLTKEQETKLVSNLDIVKTPNGNVRVIHSSNEIRIVDPFKEIADFLYWNENKESQFVSALEWINLHIPEAFNVDNITMALFEAIEKRDTSYTKDAKLKKQKNNKQQLCVNTYWYIIPILLKNVNAKSK